MIKEKKIKILSDLICINKNHPTLYKKHKAHIATTPRLETLNKGPNRSAFNRLRAQRVRSNPLAPLRGAERQQLLTCVSPRNSAERRKQQYYVFWAILSQYLNYKTALRSCPLFMHSAAKRMYRYVASKNMHSLSPVSLERFMRFASPSAGINYSASKSGRARSAYFSAKPLKLKGIKIKISGRLKGVNMARKLEVKKGNIKTQTINSFLDYKQDIIYTKWGIFGLKIAIRL